MNELMVAVVIACATVIFCTYRITGSWMANSLLSLLAEHYPEKFRQMADVETDKHHA